MPDGYLTHSSPLRRADASTIDDARAVKRLDGSVDVLGVARRDARGNPTVLLCRPLRTQRVQGDDERARRRARAKKWRGSTTVESPWPNALWLCDRELCRRVGRLEHGGGAAAARRKIDADETTARIFDAQQRRYAAMRWGLLTGKEREMCERLGGEHVEALRDRGVGGYARDDVGGTGLLIQVKCLHAHYAHYLATDGDNVVGAMVQEMLDAGEDEDVARAQREEGERRKRDG